MGHIASRHSGGIILSLFVFSKIWVHAAAECYDVVKAHDHYPFERSGSPFQQPGARSQEVSVLDPGCDAWY